MRRKKQALLLGASTLALMVFSFTAGYGLRELAVLARGGESSWVFAGERAGGPRALARIASRDGAAGRERDLGTGQVFYEVLSQLQEQYVEKLPSDTALATGALDRMLDSLRDPNTRLVEPDEAAALKNMGEGNFAGLGAVLTIRKITRADKTTERNLTVVSPIPGGPADKAGLLPGDRITEIDGRWIAPQHFSPRVLQRITEDVGVIFDPKASRSGLPKDDEEVQQPSQEEQNKRKDAAEAERRKWRTSTDLATVLRQLTVGASGTHTLTIERDGEKQPLKKEVTLGRTTVTGVTSRTLNDGVGYVRLGALNPTTASAFGPAVAGLQQKGARSLVVDLRRSPGGMLSSAQEIASRLLASGPVVVVQRRNSERKLVKQPMGVKSGVKRIAFKSIVVLVDGGTAGASEVLAAALRDGAGAKLVGAQTFGDGTEQTLFPLDNGGALELTTAKLFAPKDGDFDGKGLKPDVVIAGGAAGDAILEQALRALRPS
jgi:C-terminal peptidase prc